MSSITGITRGERLFLDIHPRNAERPPQDFQEQGISDADIRDLANQLAPLLFAHPSGNGMSAYDISDGPLDAIDRTKNKKYSSPGPLSSATSSSSWNNDNFSATESLDKLKTLLETVIARLLDRLFEILGSQDEEASDSPEDEQSGWPMQQPFQQQHPQHWAAPAAQGNKDAPPAKLSAATGTGKSAPASGAEPAAPTSPAKPASPASAPVGATAGATYSEKDPQLTAKIDELKKTNPAEAEKLEKYVANTPTMKWISSPDQVNGIRGYFDRAAAAGKPVDTMIYISPFRDQNNLNSVNGNAYSAHSGIQGWNDWHDKIKKIASDFKASGASGTLRLETDQLSLTQRMPPDQAAEVCRNMSQAVDEIKSIAPNARVMLDGGFGDPTKMADTLKNAGIAHADGFTTGVSSFNTPEQSMAFADQVANTLQSKYGIDTKYDVDTSRSGVKIDKNGSDADWSDNDHAGLGMRPRAVNDPAHAHLSNFIWGKTVWQSDGRLERAGSMIPMDRLIKYMENGLASGALQS